MTVPDEAVEAARKALDFHLPDRAQESGCALRCSYDGDDMAEHLAQHILAAAAPFIAAQALNDAADSFHARLPDGTGNGRAYNSYTVATMLREQAVTYRSEQ